MAQKLRSLLSMLLTLTLICSLAPLPAYAADTAKAVTFEFADWAQEGNQYKLPIKANCESSFEASGMQVAIKFDKAVLVFEKAEVGAVDGLTLSATNKNNANTNGTLTLMYVDIGANDHTIESGAQIATLYFSVQQDAESCDTEISFSSETKPAKITYQTNKQQNASYGDAKTCAVVGATPTLKEVTLDKTTVTVQGGTAATQSVQATATSVKGTNIATKVTWSVSPANKGVTVDNEGHVNVDAKAVADTYTITATPDDTNSRGEAKTATLSVTRATAALTSVSLDETEVTVKGGTNAAQTVTATAFDQFGDKITTGVTWGIDNNPDATNVTISGGTVSVAAKAAEGEYTVQATVDSTTKGATLKVVRETAKAAQVTVSDGATSILVPGTGAADITSAAFTATVTDQFGDSYSGDAVTWSIKDAKGQDVPGVSIGADGVVTVTDKAAETITTTGGEALTVTAACGDAKGTANITVKRDTATATTVKIYRNEVELKGTDTVVMPVKDGADKPYSYTAKLFDQYGAEMTETATWSAGTIADSAHVGFDTATATLKVKDGATKGTTVELTATMGGKSAKVTVTVTDVDVDWKGVTTKAITYGDKNSAAITLPSSGTAKAGNETLTGKFELVKPDEVQAAGDKTVAVKFTVTSAGDYKDVSVTKDFGVTVAKKAVTVKADNKTKTYGQANPTLTFTVSEGALVGSNTKDDLDVTLNCTATETTNVGDVAITGTAANTGNYNVTVTEGTLTISKATITGIVEGNPTPVTILANDAANKGIDGLKGKLNLPAKVTVSYAGSKTATLDMVWTTADTFNKKGGEYTFTGKPTVTGNFNTTDKTLTATITVTAVTGKASITSTTSTKAHAAVTAAKDWVADLGMPGQVTVAYDNSVTDGPYNITDWTPSLADLQKQATGTEDKKVTLTPTVEYPDWATISNAADVKFTMTLTPKYPVTVTVTAPADVIYGTALGDPTAAQKAIDNETDPKGTFTFTYEGRGETKYGPSAEKPTDAGTYKVVATLVSDTHSGSGEADFTISAKDVTGTAVIDLPTDFAPVYNGKAHEPVVTVKDGTDTLVLGKDYAVAYADNVNAGKATIKVTFQGNYTGTKTQDFTIDPASLADKTVTVAGTAEAGKVLSASVAEVDDVDKNVTWQWVTVTDPATEGGEPTYTDITGATKATYTVVPNDSNLAIAVKAVAKANGNYKEETKASESVTVAKFTIYGTANIQEQNKTGGTAGKIEVGDTLKVAGYIEPTAAREGSTWQWYRNGEAIENAGGTVTAAAPDMSYTVVEADAGATLKFVWTGNENFVGTVEGEIVVGKMMLTGTATIVKGDDPTALTTAAVGDVLKLALAGAPANATYNVVWCQGDTPISGATGETYTVTAADQGKQIHVQLMGTGDFTGEVRGSYVKIPAAAPDAPVVTASADDEHVTVSWTAPADNGAPITGYTVQMDSETAISLTPDKTSYTFTDLTNGTAYTFSVTAHNAVGGSDIRAVTATPKASPTLPSGGNGGGGGGSGSGSSTPSLAVSVSSKTENGKLSINTKRPHKGDTVTLTARPNAGYQVGKIIVTDKKGVLIEVKDLGNGKYSFIMPATQVNVDAEFVKVEQPAEPAPTVPEKASVSDQFQDIQGTEWFSGAVQYVYDNDLMVGVDENNFAPAVSMSRCMLITVLYRLEGNPSTSAPQFSDVPSGAYYTNAVSWAAENQIVNGFEDGSFRPNSPLTREQMATILYRYAAMKGYDVSQTKDLDEFSDVSQVSKYAKSALQWANASGVLTGTDWGGLYPSGYATRAEVAVILERFIKFTGK